MNKLRVAFLFLGDILVLYSSLFLALRLRYPGEMIQKLLESHLEPFSLVFIIWLFIFYVNGLYDLRNLKSNINFAKEFWSSLGIAFLIAVAFFYLIPVYGIGPKTNLFIFFGIFIILGFGWRYIFNSLTRKGGPSTKLLVIGDNKNIQELAEVVQKNPQLGYGMKFWMKQGLQDPEINHLAQIILANKIDALVVPARIKKDYSAAKMIYKNLVLGIEVLDLATIYEDVLRKVPLNELEEVWFLENLSRRYRLYETLERPFELLLAVPLFLFSLPLMILISVLIKLSSRGPIIYKQTRVGKNEIPFTLYKFRTMKANAETNGPQWASPKDPRTTFLGRILRRTHLDELPQLVNVLKGELSFVGPRPERPEFVNELKERIPYYEIRHLTKPGITGWAQINYRYGASIEDAKEKLQHDIYYLKNRSFVLDIVIILKTIRYFFKSIT